MVVLLSANGKKKIFIILYSTVNGHFKNIGEQKFQENTRN
jgi:hypothetical protein